MDPDFTHFDLEDDFDARTDIRNGADEWILVNYNSGQRFDLFTYMRRDPETKKLQSALLSRQTG